MNKVKAAWERIGKVLNEKYPNIKLRPGASAEEVEQFSINGFKAPPDLIEMYLLHDAVEGDALFLLGLETLTASGVIGHQSLCDDHLELAVDTGNELFFDNPSSGINGADFFEKRSTLLPIGSGPGYVCVEASIDAASTTHGRVLWMDLEANHLEIVSPSIASFLGHCAQDLEEEIYTLDPTGLFVEIPDGPSYIESFVRRWNGR